MKPHEIDEEGGAQQGHAGGWELVECGLQGGDGPGEVPRRRVHTRRDPSGPRFEARNVDPGGACAELVAGRDRRVDVSHPKLRVHQHRQELCGPQPVLPDRPQAAARRGSGQVVVSPFQVEAGRGEQGLEVPVLA